MKLKLPTLDDAWGIHALIVELYSKGEISIAFFNNARVPEAIAELRSAGIKKPLFASAGNWLRATLIQNRVGFWALGSFTELEFLVDGKRRIYYGFGQRQSDPLPEGHFMRERFYPKPPVIRIPIVNHFDRFAPFLTEGAFSDKEIR
jgi:hypothetical protein